MLSALVVFDGPGIFAVSGATLDIQKTSAGIFISATNVVPGRLVLQQSRDPVSGDWLSTHAIGVDNTTSSQRFPAMVPAGLNGFFRALVDGDRPNLKRYVNANSGNDSNDGLSPEMAFRTLARALKEIPTVLLASYDIILAPGLYAGSIEVVRAGSSSDISPEDIFRYPIDLLPVIKITGDANGKSVVRASAGKDAALRFMNVGVALRNLNVEAADANGILVTGGTLVAENVQVSTKVSAGAGVYCHRSNLYLGGTNSITGPFVTGISLRSYSIARPGTRDFPQNMSLDIDGAVECLFLRDFSTFTSTFNSAKIRFRNSYFAVYAILGSNVFFTGGDGEVFMDIDNVGTVFHLTHRSEANVHNLRLNGLRDHFCVCTLMSMVVVEGGTVPANLVITNLDSTSFLRIPTSWGATTR